METLNYQGYLMIQYIWPKGQGYRASWNDKIAYLCNVIVDMLPWQHRFKTVYVLSALCQLSNYGICYPRTSHDQVYDLNKFISPLVPNIPGQGKNQGSYFDSWKLRFHILIRVFSVILSSY